MADVVIRPAVAADVDAIAGLAARTFPLACPPTADPADIEAHIASELTPARFQECLREHTLVVATVSGSLVGYLMLTDEPAPVDVMWRRPLEVRRIYADPGWHGRGVGDGLMHFAVAEAYDRGRDHVWLGTNVANGRAIAFYRRHGFEVIGRRTFFVAGSAECDYVMGRPVGAADRRMSHA